jgi:hypothetical protein
MFVVAGLAYKTGDPMRLLKGTDSYGNLCGQKNLDIPNGKDMTAKPLLYFANPLQPSEDQVCVAACPVKAFSFSDSPLYQVDTNIFCSNFSGTPTITQVKYVGACMTNCPCFPAYPSTELLGRCLPNVGSFIGGTAGNVTLTKAVLEDEIRNFDIGRQLAADVNSSKYIILGMIGVALVLSFIWLILLRFCAACMVWLTIILVFAGLVCITGFLAFEAKLSYENYKVLVAAGTNTLEDELQEKTLIALAILAGVFLLVFLVVLLFMRPRIQLAISIIKEASSAMRAVPCVIFVPAIVLIFTLGFFAYWIAAWVYLNSAGVATFNADGTFKGYEDTNKTRQLQIYHLFGLLWTTAFLIGINEMVIAGSIATWYFTRDKRKLPCSVVLRTCGRTMRYHVGTVAFGSFLIAVVQAIRLIISYMQKQLKGSQWRIARFMLKCLGYCFACFERFLKFVTRNAFIHAAIFGDNFCTSAKCAMSTLMRNAARLIAINFIGSFLMFLGKIFVVAVTGIAATYVLQYYKDKIGLHYWALPLIIILFCSYGLVTLFLGTYNMAIDTIFLCFCEDSERHDGSPGREPYMSAELRDHVHNNTKHDDKTKGGAFL